MESSVAEEKSSATTKSLEETPKPEKANETLGKPVPVSAAAGDAPPPLPQTAAPPLSTSSPSRVAPPVLPKKDETQVKQAPEKVKEGAPARSGKKSSDPAEGLELRPRPAKAENNSGGCLKPIVFFLIFIGLIAGAIKYFSSRSSDLPTFSTREPEEQKAALADCSNDIRTINSLVAQNADPSKLISEAEKALLSCSPEQQVELRDFINKLNSRVARCTNAQQEAWKMLGENRPRAAEWVLETSKVECETSEFEQISVRINEVKEKIKSREADFADAIDGGRVAAAELAMNNIQLLDAEYEGLPLLQERLKVLKDQFEQQQQAELMRQQQMETPWVSPQSAPWQQEQQSNQNYRALLRDAEQALSAGRFDQARGIVDSVLRMDSGNQEAYHLRQRINDAENNFLDNIQIR